MRNAPPVVPKKTVNPGSPKASQFTSWSRAPPVFAPSPAPRSSPAPQLPSLSTSATSAEPDGGVPRPIACPAGERYRPGRVRLGLGPGLGVPALRGRRHRLSSDLHRRCGAALASRRAGAFLAVRRWRERRRPLGVRTLRHHASRGGNARLPWFRRRGLGRPCGACPVRSGRGRGRATAARSLGRP